MRFIPVTVPFCLLIASSAPAAEMTRGPFLQQTSPERTLVVVHTDGPADVEVRAGAPGNPAIVVAESSGATRHVLELPGLPSASDVTYDVLVDGVEVVSSKTFRTPGRPGTAAGRKAVIGVIGDMGSGMPKAKENAKRMHERGIELMLTVGDNSYPDGAPSEWDSTFFGPFAPLLAETTVMPTVGDHEYLTPYAQGYLDAFELPEHPFDERAYSFDWGDLHVVSVDTNCFEPVDAATAGCSGDDLAAWMDEDLTVSKAPWKIITMHRAALASARYDISGPVSRVIVPLAQKHGVDLVFQGHSHSWERTWPVRDGEVVQKSYDRPGAPVYVTTGGGGDWVYDTERPQPEWSAYRLTAHQHTILTLDGPTLRVDAVGLDGSVLDSFTLTKDIAPLRVDPTDEGGEWPTRRDGTGCAASGAIPSSALALSLVVILRRRRR